MMTGFYRSFRKHLISICLIAVCIFCTSSPGNADQKYSIPLTLQDRVRFQRAIEQVYWNHRLWPKENKSPRPRLDTVLPEVSLSAKVEDSLQKSNALAEEWRQPITPAQLQAEMDRMARTSKNPEMLRELFAALRNDPTVIAECLARPALADRLIHNWYAYDSRFNGALKQQAESELRRYGSAGLMRNLSGQYTESEWALRQNNGVAADHSDPSAIMLDPGDWKVWTGALQARFADPGRRRGGNPKIPMDILSPLKEDETGFFVATVLEAHPDRIRLAVVRWQKRPFDSWWSERKASMPADISGDPVVYSLPAITAASCADDTWSATGSSPSPRMDHTAVWTGSEMIVWGGMDISNNVLSSGGRYDPATDTWTPTSSAGAPTRRRLHSAVWTGSQMIIWGGYDNNVYTNTGSRYDPATDTWTATTTVGVPEARDAHTAVWAGSQMIVWGGFDDNIVSVYLNTGGRYNPINDTWVTISTTNAPAPRNNHAAIWTGSQMIVWGGYNGMSFDSGGRYNPSNDTWTATSSTGAPAARFHHTGIWTGSQMIVWGGFDELLTPLNTGGRYNPATDTWAPTATVSTPPGSAQHTAVWTGSRMIVWGGFEISGATNTGGRYDPSTDSWTLTSAVSAPGIRFQHTAVWTGLQMIVWGGQSNTDVLSTGGRYDPSTDTWTSTSINVAAAARSNHTAVWTGSQMIVWGGFDSNFLSLNTGGRYDPATNTWTPTSTIAAPDARLGHTAVWSGSLMILWGGRDSSPFNTGGRYDPATDTWTPTRSSGSIPAARYGHTAVWTGSLMILWGGRDAGGQMNTGSRYDPATDSWLPTSTNNAPAAREAHTSVWAGSLMIVWGGFAPAATNTGGRYDPSTDTWTATSTTNAPDARVQHTAVWTGSLMIVWGGHDANYFNTGGRYDPITDSWTSTATASAPTARYAHTAVWTGSQMIIWGGNDAGNVFQTGGRFDPSANSWTPTSTVGAPNARTDQTAVWAGSQMIVWGGRTNSLTSLETGGRYCALPPVPCLFCDDFEDGVLAADWTYIKTQWSETGGDLIGASAKKAIGIASPAFDGCLNCSVEATVSTPGGVGSRVWMLGWYIDKRNDIELMLNPDRGKWILKERSNGRIVAKAKAVDTIAPNVFYNVVIAFDGSHFTTTVDGAQLLQLTPVASVPSGTVGFQLKNTTAHFGEIEVN